MAVGAASRREMLLLLLLGKKVKSSRRDAAPTSARLYVIALGEKEPQPKPGKGKLERSLLSGGDLPSTA